MNISFWPLATLCLLLLTPFPLLPAAAATPPKSQEEPSPGPTVEPTPTQATPTFLDSTTVTARGYEAEVFGISTPVSVIPQKQIERQLPENAVDLLVDLPGADLLGVGRNQSRPIVRGQRGLRVLLLEDGVRLNHPRRQADFGEIAGVFDPGDLERIEVVRGPLSVLYGSDALGGVVHLISKDPPDSDRHRPVGQIDARYRSGGNLLRLGFSTAANGKRWRGNFFGSTRDAGDYHSGKGSFGALRATERLLVEDTGIVDQSLAARLTFDWNPSWSLLGRFRSYWAENAGFGFVEPDRLNSTDPTRLRIRIPKQRYNRLSLGLEGAPRTRLAESFELSLAFQENDRILTNEVDLNLGPTVPGAQPSTLRVESRNTTDLNTHSLRFQLGKQVGKRSLWTYGFEWLQESAQGTDFSTSTTRLRFPFPPFERVTVQSRDLPNLPNAVSRSAGLFLQEEHNWNERWKSTAAIRYQQARTVADPTRGWNVENLDFNDDQLVGTLSVVTQLSTRVQGFASYGLGFRAPNMVELLFEGPTPEGAGFQVRNPELTSETSTSWDLGVRYRNSRVSLEAVTFRSDLRDGIVQVFLSSEEIAALPANIREAIRQSRAQLVVAQRNLDRLRIQGVEIALELRNLAGLAAGLNLSYLDDQRPGVSAEPVEGLYRARWTWHLTYQPTGSNWWAEYRGRFQKGNPLPTDPSIPLPPVGARVPDFDLHSLAFGLSLGKASRDRHQISLRIENLSDRLYSEAANSSFFRPEPGREWIVAYQMRF